MRRKKGTRSPKYGTLEVVKLVLEKADLEPEPAPQGNGYLVRFSDGPQVQGIALVYEGESQFVFYLEFLKPASKEILSEVAEYITRANFGITIGNFEMDYGSGLIRFKSSVDYSGVKLSETLVRNVLLDAMDAVEVYNGGLSHVILGTRKPLQAIQEVEGDLGQE